MSELPAAEAALAEPVAPASSPAAAPPSLEELRSVFESIRAAVDARDAALARRSRVRTLGNGLLVLILAAMVAGFGALAAGFDVEVFRDALRDGLAERAPDLLAIARRSADEIAPVYQAEIDATLPAFTADLAAALAKEAGHLGEKLAPTIGTAALSEADASLAKALREAFPQELKTPEAATAFVARLRAEQQKAAAVEEARDAYVIVRQIHDAVETLGPPDKGELAAASIADGVKDAAFDVLKARLSSADSLGFSGTKGGLR